MHHPVFVLELKIAVRHLNRDRSQHALVRDADIIRAHVKRQELCGKPRSDHGFQVLELDLGRLEDFCIEVEASELVHALGLAAERPPGGHAVRAREPVGLRGHPHRFELGQTGVRHVKQSVFFAGVNRQVVLTGHGGIDEFQNDVGADAVDVAIPPLLERIG